MVRSAKILFTLLFLTYGISVLSQRAMLRVIVLDTTIQKYKQPTYFNSQRDAFKQLGIELLQWQQQGYIAASFDSVRIDSAGITALLHLGKKYDASYYTIRGVEGQSNQKAPKLTFKQLQQIIEKKIQFFEQRGYPFVQVNVIPVAIQSEVISMRLDVDSGSFFIYDSLLIAGNSMQDKLFLMRYLNIKPGMPYNEATIVNIDRQLRQLQYLKVIRPSAVYFHQNKARIVISIDDKPSNNFEGVAGIRNDENKAGKYAITGDVNLSLLNVFNAAASFKMQWRSYGVQNSDLGVQGYYPYLLGAPFALSDEFSLYRQDSNFQRLKNNIGFSYLFSGLNALQFYYTIEKSNATLTNIQKFQALESNMLPPVNDYVNRNYGIRISYRNLDQLFNPSSGVQLLLDISAGTHAIIPNPLLKDAKNSAGKSYSVYDSLPAKTTAAQVFLLHDGYILLAPRNVLNVFVQGASMYHPNILYNEQFQLGGLKTFRGVNELAIKATSYALLRTEYRYILPQTGYFNLFCNGIWYEENLVNSYHRKTIFGFGGGLGIQAKGGLLTVLYALASDNDYVLKYGKVHVGFTAVF